jgi:very-short-patch-repair endonuclease
VYAIAGAPESWEQDLLAVCLAGGPRTHVAFEAAARLHSLVGFDSKTVEVVQFGKRPSVIEGVVVHESEVFGPAHVARVGVLPVTSVARTLCDLTAVSTSWVVEKAVDDALRRQIVTLKALARVAADLEGRGRLRCTMMREILEQRASGYHPGESDPEKRVAEVLVRAGLPEPVRQHWVSVRGRRYRIDLCYPELGIAIEYDGWDHHKGRQAFDADRARGNDLVVLGMQLLRFTSRSSDDTIADTVRSAIARASAS